MALKRILITGILAVVFISVKAQNSRDNGDALKTPQTVIEPIHQRDVHTVHRVKGFHWKRQNVKHTAQYEFYKRVELAAKEHQRTLRKLHKPQYSDFSYYGHKHKPKRHAAGKLRFCKECGIRH